MIFEFDSLGDDDDITVGFFAFALGICDIAVCKRTVNDTSFKRIHRFECDLSLKAECLLSEFKSECGERFSAFFAVVFAIYYDFFEIALLLVEEGERKILECVESLSSVTDRNAAVVAGYRNIKRAVFVLYARTR